MWRSPIAVLFCSIFKLYQIFHFISNFHIIKINISLLFFYCFARVLFWKRQFYKYYYSFVLRIIENSEHIVNNIFNRNLWNLNKFCRISWIIALNYFYSLWTIFFASNYFFKFTKAILLSFQFSICFSLFCSVFNLLEIHKW